MLPFYTYSKSSMFFSALLKTATHRTNGTKAICAPGNLHHWLNSVGTWQVRVSLEPQVQRYQNKALSVNCQQCQLLILQTGFPGNYHTVFCFESVLFVTDWALVSGRPARTSLIAWGTWSASSACCCPSWLVRLLRWLWFDVKDVHRFPIVLKWLKWIQFKKDNLHQARSIQTALRALSS